LLTRPALPDGLDRPRSVTAAFALVGLPIALVLFLAGLMAWQSEREAQANIEARAVNAAHTASAHVRWVVEANLQALQRVADAVARRPDLLEGRETLDLNDAVSALPGEVHVWVFDAQGRSVLHNGPAAASATVADRDYFQALRDGAAWQIGALLTGQTTKAKLFPIGRRIDRDGRFAGAVVIYVPADLLAEFWASMALGPGSTVGLLRDDGWLVARYPVPERSINLAAYELFTEHLRRAPRGTYGAAASPADGRARIVGYQRIEGLPLVTVVGIPVTSLFQTLQRRIGEIVLLSAPIGFALLLVSLWAVRLLRQEERARRALAVALEDNRMLLREVHHRVKNNLQTVSALIQLQPGPADGKEDLRRRIGAMAALHEQIYGSDQFDRLDIGAYIEALVARLREGYGGTIEVECRVAPVRIEADQALPFSLIVNEVVSNAFKHAFPDGRRGRIRVSLEAAPDGSSATLVVRDDGVGYDPAKASGMGTRLIRGLAQQLGAEVQTRVENGSVFTLTVPLEAGAGAEPESRAA
jgi:two-component sensor histidine kinase